jgi:hypothetical protein
MLHRPYRFTCVTIPFCIAALTACGSTPSPAKPDPVPDPDPTFPYPLDDVLRLSQIQVKSTHNSYHVQTQGTTVDAWKYTHAPLDVQLGEQGVRQIELDLRLNASLGHFEVYHLPVVDEQTSCRTLTDCLTLLKTWSDAHRAHHPVVVQFEFKDPFPGATAESYFETLHAEITSVWPEERIVTPAMVQGQHATLSEAVQTEGWPLLGQVRGHIVFTIDGVNEFQIAYTHNRTSLDGRLIFAASSPSDPFAATVVLNDPIGDADAIAAALAANMLVRTRADSDSVEALAGDTTRRDAALASGAQFVSTDYPEPITGMDYWVEMPGGMPSRCNPVTAPAECSSEAVEDPDFVGP